MSNSNEMRTKLASAAKKLGLRMPQVQLLLAQERFLFRIANIDEDNKLIWKGGSLILRTYSNINPPRFTSDIDLMTHKATVSAGESLIREAAQLDLHDGFQYSKIERFPMERDTPYGGERFEISWTFEKKQNSEPLWIDLCAGDDVDPKLVHLNEVYLLDDDASEASLLIYPPEFIFAEKLETLVRFGTGNTRLKDFIDLWTLMQLQKNEFSVEGCKKAIKRCFERRETKLSSKVWKKILNDDEFQTLMEDARKRNFPKLEVPHVQKMFFDIEVFLDSISDWNETEDRK